MPQIGNYINTANIKNAVFHLKSYGLLSLKRKALDCIEFMYQYNGWRKEHLTPDDELAAQRRQERAFSRRPLISIVVPLYKTPEPFLREMIESVLAQTYTNWELCLADGSADDSVFARESTNQASSESIKSARADSASSRIVRIISEYQSRSGSGRIRYTCLPENLGISGNTNAALALAGGEYVALLDHDDVLAPDALYEIVAALNRNPGIDVLYTDEDKMSALDGNYYDPYFKPDFSIDLLRSCNYITHFYVVRKSLADRAGGFSDECNGSQDYDFILKTTELADSICHIPKILYHWRVHNNSVAGDPENKTWAYDAALRALENHLKRCQISAAVQKAPQFGYYQVSYACQKQPLISVLLLDCPDGLKGQLTAISSWQNFEFVSSVQQATGAFLAVFYHVKEMWTADWAEQLFGNCQRGEIGLTSARVYYAKNKILESGLLYTTDGQLRSPFYKFHDSDTGYCYLAMSQRNCSVVGPWCFMTKTADFRAFLSRRENQPFDETVYRYCDTLVQSQHFITVLPQVRVLVPKSARIAHSGLPSLDCYQGRQDPFYNPNLSEREPYHLP
ncbi:MAG: glycosyltransferase [Lachnospiraceae bacterium]|nr:glycosyltransferase [Lachnospiraceae bacterium]